MYGVEIDTAFFNGNEAPAISVEAFAADMSSTSADKQKVKDQEVITWGYDTGKWETILSKQPCGPTRRQAWMLEKPTSRPYTHFRLKMYPDGGIARFRLYGRPAPPATTSQETLDLAAAINGGRCIDCSDQHFSSTSNLLLPGRGVDMSDGWETRRSRHPEHIDWVMVKLGVPGKVNSVVVDTAHFRGNFPDKCQAWGINWQGKDGEPSSEASGWIDLSGLQDCEADKEHVFQCSDKVEGALSHVKVVIVPDGGVKRVRAFGVPSQA